MDTILDNSITLDIESEEELVMRIEQQLENYYNEPIMIDYLDFYARRFVGVPDYEDISKLEDYIDTSEERNRYLEMIQMLKVRFIKYLGINCYNSTDEEIEFETLYAIYYTFVLNIDKVLACYLLGLITESNEKFNNKDVFTLEYCANELMRKNRIELIGQESMSPASILECLNAEKILSKEEDTTSVLTKFIHSSEVFKILYRKVFFNEYYFSNVDNLIQFLFELLIEIDDNQIYHHAFAKMLAYEYSIDIEFFIPLMEKYLLQDSTIDRVENIYRKKLESYKKTKEV